MSVIPKKEGGSGRLCINNTISEIDTFSYQNAVYPGVCSLLKITLWGKKEWYDSSFKDKETKTQKIEYDQIRKQRLRNWIWIVWLLF